MAQAQKHCDSLDSCTHNSHLSVRWSSVGYGTSIERWTPCWMESKPLQQGTQGLPPNSNCDRCPSKALLSVAVCNVSLSIQASSICQHCPPGLCMLCKLLQSVADCFMLWAATYPCVPVCMLSLLILNKLLQGMRQSSCFYCGSFPS